MAAGPVFSAGELDRLGAEASEPFRAVAPWKLVLLSVATFGLYQIVWLHRNWVARKKNGEEVIPILRAILGVFYFPSLASRIRGRRLFHDLPGGVNPALLGVAYFALNLAFRLPDPYWLAGVFSFLPLVDAQRKVNDLHRHLGFPSVDARLGFASLVTLAAGGLLWLLVLTGLLLPEAS